MKSFSDLHYVTIIEWFVQNSFRIAFSENLKGQLLSLTFTVGVCIALCTYMHGESRTMMLRTEYNVIFDISMIFALA